MSTSSGAGGGAGAAADDFSKVVLMGGGGVGKSCLTFRLIHNQFLERYDPTLEDFYRKDNFRVDDELCPIEIYDTAGQDAFMSMRDKYYKTGDGFLFVFSLTDSSSLEDVKERFRSLLFARGCEANEIPPVTIVGNKCDLEEARVVSYELGQSVAKELGPTVGYVETSAKANIKVEEVFQDIVRKIKAAEAEKRKSSGKGGKKSKDNGCINMCCVL